MTTLLYDGTFDGLLTAIFEVFEYRYQDVEIKNRENFQQENMFAEIHEVVTQTEKSERGKNCNSVSCSWNYYGIYSGQQTEHKKVILGNGKL